MLEVSKQVFANHALMATYFASFYFTRARTAFVALTPFSRHNTSYKINSLHLLYQS